ncbi:LOW QUALITY PROTEIN: hypothetical protein M514_27675 [Trichuris suis]|uniref:Integrase catalytic domain-containing protein n=2 Tax=Trichuris suis TaxID=68888 RepID=A0A085MSF1_9BILA|nr:LOW QUALITY PROTEIN: hypothetical protein M514_27675 [Trichuris suis]
MAENTPDNNCFREVVRLLRSKDEVTGAIMEYVAKMENPGQQLKKYFREEGIEHQTTIPYTPQQNGVAERRNRSLTEMAKCILLGAGLHNRFWGEAVRTAAYLQNRLPSRSVDRTPFEHFLGRKPELGHIRVFGSKVFCLVPKQRRRKWDDKAVEGVLIGYDDATKGYRILDPKTNRTWVSCSVKIVEKAGVEKCIAAPEPEGEVERELMTSQPKEGVLANLDRPEEERLPTAASNQVSNVEEDQNLSEDEGLILPATETLIRRSHRANKGIPPKKLCYRVQVPRKMEPSSWDEMLSFSPAEKENGSAEEEMKSLKDYKVWELVDLPQGKKPISCKWVFKAKLDSQGRVQTYNARLVARGFSQKYGEDYERSVGASTRLHNNPTAMAMSGLDTVIHVQQDIRGFTILFFPREQALISLTWHKAKDGSFLLCQKGKIAEMPKEHGMLEPKTATTPMETGYLNSLLDKSKTLPNNKRYRQAIGSLLYLATVSRPDIAMAVGLLCRRVEAPTEREWKSVKRVMRYLATTIDRKLHLSSGNEMELQCYVDAEWAGDKTDRKSTSGYVFKLGKSPVAWSSRKQSLVALSSTEAEYVAASHACKELLWLRQLLDDMGLPQTAPTMVYEDNQGCIRLLESDRCGSRTKHIDVRHHQLRNLREQGVITIQYCPSEEMTADILTKPLGKERFRKFTEQLGLQD